MRKRLAPGRLLLHCLLPLAMALAAPTLVVAEEDDRAFEQWYEVEVIIFRQWEQGGRHAERWPTRAGLPHYPLWQVPAGCLTAEEAEAEDALGLDEDPARDEIEAQTLEAQDFHLHCLPAERRRLSAEWGALVRSDAYVPIHHVAWVQPGYNRETAVAVPVPYTWHPPTAQEALGETHAPPRYQPPVFGLIRIYRERFLHAAVDLRLHHTASGRDVDSAERLRAPLHQMTDTRRMRSGELHYMDHPALGVLITIHPIDEPPGTEREED